LSHENHLRPHYIIELIPASIPLPGERMSISKDGVSGHR